MKVTRTELDYAETGMFPPLFLDYLAGKKDLAEFYSFFPDLPGHEKALKDIGAYTFDRQLLAKMLAEQNPGKEKTANRLLDAKTFTVCTGHQLCLFTGPLYFIYKIITAINLAERLKKQHPG